MRSCKLITTALVHSVHWNYAIFHPLQVNAADAPDQKNHGIILHGLQDKAADALDQKNHGILLHHLQDKAANALDEKNHGIILHGLQGKAAEEPKQKNHAILLCTLQDKATKAQQQKNHAILLCTLQDKAAKAVEQKNQRIIPRGLQDKDINSPEWKTHDTQNDTENDSTLSAHSSVPADINGKSNPVLSMQHERSSKPITKIAAALKDLKELNKAISNPIVVDEECETFGRHIVAQLKKLNPENCIMAQEDIQQVLTKYRRVELSSNKSGSAPP